MDNILFNFVIDVLAFRGNELQMQACIFFSILGKI